MISVLVLASDPAATGRPATAADAVRTLSALVPGAVDGVLRDVQLLAPGTAADLAQVADHAGCGFVAAADLNAAIAAGARDARSPHVFVLQAGVGFDRALTEEMGGLAAGEDATWLAGSIGLKAVAGGALGRFLPGLAPTVGVLATRDRLLAAGAPHVRGLWRTLRPRRHFKTRAWTGGA